MEDGITVGVLVRARDHMARQEVIERCQIRLVLL
jgi:hypothetical protein